MDRKSRGRLLNFVFWAEGYVCVRKADNVVMRQVEEERKEFCRGELSYARNLPLRLVNREASAAE